MATTIKILGIVAAIAAITAGFQYYKNIKLVKEYDKSVAESEVLQHKINELTTKNEELADKLNPYVIGEDAFCYIQLEEDSIKKHTFHATIINASDEYDIKNVALKLIYKNDPPLFPEDNEENTHLVGEIPKQGTYDFGEFHFQYPDNKIKFYALYSTGNKHFIQLIYMKKQNGVWCGGTRVSEFLTGRLLFAQVDECVKNDAEFYEP